MSDSPEEVNNNGENVTDKPNWIIRTLGWLVTLLVPVALVLTAMRLMLTPAFLQLEYNMPGFPDDRYGFTKQDRLYWSRFALDYLLNSADISYLEDLRFEDGGEVYNQRELAHMIDVKIAVEAALLAWYLSMAGLFILGLLAWRGDWAADFLASLRRGGWLTVILLGTLIFIVILSFGVFFVAFHNVFFDAGTWMFKYSDTLIRLFPERFWRDIFIYVGLLAAGAGLALGIGLRNKG